MQTLKKQLLLYLLVFVVLSVFQHPDLLVSPLEKLSRLPSADAFGFGPLHPLIFSFIGYLFVAALGFVFSLLKKVFTV